MSMTEAEVLLSAAMCALQDIEGECRSRPRTTLSDAIMRVLSAHAADPYQYGVIGTVPRPLSCGEGGDRG